MVFQLFNKKYFLQQLILFPTQINIFRYSIQKMRMNLMQTLKKYLFIRNVLYEFLFVQGDLFVCQVRFISLFYTMAQRRLIQQIDNYFKDLQNNNLSIPFILYRLKDSQINLHSISFSSLYSTRFMIQNNQEQTFENSLNEIEPPHPKTFAHIQIRANMKFTNQLYFCKVLQNHRAFVQTAKQPFRNKQQKTLPKRGPYTSRNSRIISVKAPSTDNSPNAKDDQLFIPERKKINDTKKFLSQKRTLKNKQKINIVTPPIRQSYGSINLTQNDPKKNPFQTIALKSNIPKQNRATIHHLVHLRKYQNTQRQRQVELNNRLRFLTVQQQKDSKRLQFVKKKYERIAAVRSQVNKEKQSIEKRKIANYIEEMNEKHKKFSKIKELKEQKNISVSRFSQSKSLEASRFRTEEKKLIDQKRNQQMAELQKKQESVKASLLRSKQGHQKIIQANKSRIDAIRSIENRQIVRSYLNISQKQKINKKLQERLQKEMTFINEKKLKSVNKLRQYEEFLGLRKKKTNQIDVITKNKVETSNSSSLNLRKAENKAKIGSTRQSTLGSRSFYLTNI